MFAILLGLDDFHFQVKKMNKQAKNEMENTTPNLRSWECAYVLEHWRNFLPFITRVFSKLSHESPCTATSKFLLLGGNFFSTVLGLNSWGH